MPKSTVEAGVVRAQLTALLSRVAGGESIALTKYGRVVAHLTPPSATPAHPTGGSKPAPPERDANADPQRRGKIVNIPPHW